ncbi:MAG TPA: hydantoinase B/oxoprolinase family protein, partial [Saprospiraceae bacterium]|nr:hydantoinase B/oxoprolinase family protein [Saprospiraceae bacterium]
DAGIFSARGIGQTTREAIKIRQINAPLESSGQSLNTAFKTLEAEARAELRRFRVLNENIRIGRRMIYLRFKGQDQVIAINWVKGMDILSEFRAEYRRIYQSTLAFEVEIEKILVRVIEKSGDDEIKNIRINRKKSPPASGQKKFIRWAELEPGCRLTGPCTVSSNQASVLVAEGWKLQVQDNKDLVLIPERNRHEVQNWAPAINLELFQNRFRSIAEQMGAQLQYSAFSVNVKERLDFSCAILDDQARLLVNAPHIPVHLGSLGISARLVLRDFELGPGDILLSNHPSYGGSHLPDLTLLKAVYDDHQRLIGYVTNRAHHAEIGGMTPGSMPAFATRLDEEGVIFKPTYIYRGGRADWKQVRKCLTSARYPSRNPDLNILDLRAAIAALLAGEKRLQSLAKTYGREYLRKQMRRILYQGKEQIGEYIRKHEGARLRAMEYLDDGHCIRLVLSIKKGKMTLDFSGSSGVHPGNLNANPAIVQSVVLYTLRLLCDRDISLNEGILHQVKIILPQGFINPLFPASDADSPAVVGGNTEVSQRLTDCLIKAFGLAACSQGTMNNFLFGNKKYTYYETIGGGTGAGPGFHGRSAIHQHMTNTKITDPEELEWRYPVRLEKFEIRRGSGGSGRWQGGNGICRQIRFLEPMTVTILAQHRKEKPYGLEGGFPGKCGKEMLFSKNQASVLNSNQSFEVKSGDMVKIETPGGGGWGKLK